MNIFERVLGRTRHSAVLGQRDCLLPWVTIDKRFWPLLVLFAPLGAWFVPVSSALAQASRLEETATEVIAVDRAELCLEVVQAPYQSAHPHPMAARVVVTDSSGGHPDGSGRGVYADGRFFVEGDCTVAVSPGEARIRIACGPHVVPVDETVTVAAGHRVRLRALMHRWIDPTAMGWYCGDNHVHTQHDRQTAVRVDPAYTALQARANDLNYITEADSEITADRAAQFDTATLLYRAAPELRPGPFAGHVNTPGIAHPLAAERYQQLVGQPLPRQAIGDAVHQLGGAIICTHPLSPPYQLHWMGAAEAWSDAALGRVRTCWTSTGKHPNCCGTPC